MSLNQYHLISQWRVEASIEECFDIIADARSRTRWWPAAYLDVLEIQPGDENGVGKVVRATTKGLLPAILRWHFSVTEATRPDRIRIRAWGDFEGEGIWTFVQDGQSALLTFEWRIKLNKSPLRQISPLLKPLVELNHRWAMARGEESLRLEIDRRHTREQDLHLLPPPPQPTQLPMKPIWIGLGVVAALVFVQRRRRRR